MIAAEKDFRHLHAAEDTRAGVLRIFQTARLAVRLFRQTFGIAQHARDVSDYCINNNHGRHLAAVADEVAGRNLSGLQPLPNPLVEPFVPPAQE